MKHILLLSLLLCISGSASAVERRAGCVRLSNGDELRGEIWFNEGKLRIYEGKGSSGGRYLNATQNELVSITFSPQDQSMERPWRFKEAGSDQKEFLPGEYPLINLKSETKLASGKTLEGHLMTAPVFIRTPGTENPMDFDTQKFILRYQHKGEAGQAYKDIVYVAAITFAGAAQTAGENGTISGTIRDCGTLQQVTALGIERMQTYRAKTDPAKGTFVIENLPKDRYDIAVMTDLGFFAGLSDATPAAKAAPRALERGDEAAIAREIAKFRDFFEVQEVWGVKGHRECAKVLVHQRRVAPVNDQQALGTKEQHRLDVWCWHMRSSEWHINERGRMQLFRYFEEKEGVKRGVQIVSELGGLELDPAVKKTAEVNYSRLKPETRGGERQP